MTPDIRDDSIGAVKLLKHFDILTRPKSLTPFHSQVNGDSSASTNKMADFLYYNSIIYGRGVVSGTAKAQVNTKSDFTSATWGAQGHNAAGSGTAVEGVFVEYHGYSYGFNSDGSVWKNDLAGGVAWNDSITTIGSSAVKGSIAACVHSKDDCLYMATANVIGRNNNGSWTANALTLPARYLVTSMCEYGNYLAIACKPVYSGKSVVYLWDRDSSLTTVSEVIDFGLGNLQVIEQFEGQLIGVSVRQDVFTSLQTKLVFRVYSGGSAIVFKEMLASTTVGLQLVYGQKLNANRLYFLAGLTIDGTLHNGVWGIGKNQYGRLVVWFDKLVNNDTAIDSGGLVGFFMVGDFTFISYTASGNYSLTQTSSNTNAYSGSSIIETVINPNMPLIDRTKNKQVMVTAVSFDPIPSGGQIICKYKVDGGSWTTIFTETTQGRVVKEKTVKSVLGREFQFRIESTGGVVVTGIKYSYQITRTLI